MNLQNAIAVGFKEIWANKFRSMLTMLGMILGVSSLVAMSALVKGMEMGAKEALIAIGGLQKIRIEPQDVPLAQRHLRDQAVGVTMNDVRALQSGAPLVTRISPEMRLFGATVSARGKTFRPFITSGVWPVALEMSEHEIEHGRMFNELDDEMARSVCVIGTPTRDELFGSPEETGEEIIPIWETLYLNGQPFQAVDGEAGEAKDRVKEVAGHRLSSWRSYCWFTPAAGRRRDGVFGGVSGEPPACLSRSRSPRR